MSNSFSIDLSDVDYKHLETEVASFIKRKIFDNAQIGDKADFALAIATAFRNAGDIAHALAVVEIVFDLFPSDIRLICELVQLTLLVDRPCDEERFALIRTNEELRRRNDIAFRYLDAYHRLRRIGKRLEAHAVVEQAYQLFPEHIGVKNEFPFSVLVKEDQDCISEGVFFFYSFGLTRPNSLGRQKEILRALYLDTRLAPYHRANCAVAYAYKAIETESQIEAELALRFLEENHNLLDGVGEGNTIRDDRFALDLSRTIALIHLSVFLNRADIFSKIMEEGLIAYHLNPDVSMRPTFYQAGLGVVRIYAFRFCVQFAHGCFVEAKDSVDCIISTLELVFRMRGSQTEHLLFQEFSHFSSLAAKMIDALGSSNLDFVDPPNNNIEEIFNDVHHLRHNIDYEVTMNFRAKFFQLVEDIKNRSPIKS